MTAAAAKSRQSCPTPCDPIDGSPPGSPVPEILQARTLEWVAAGVQPRWIQGDSKVGGRSRRLWKNTYLITDIERLEMDSVVGRLVEKKRLNNLDYVE